MELDNPPSENYKTIVNNHKKKPIRKILLIIVVSVILFTVGLISYNLYKNKYDSLEDNEKNITTTTQEEIIIPKMGEIIENPDGSKIALGRVKQVKERVVYLEVNNKTLSIETDKNTKYSINYHGEGIAEIKTGLFEDIEINDILSILFKKMEDGSFVSLSIIINK